MALIDITPVMTSNTTPAPYKVSASGVLTVDFAPWKAFNKTNTGGFDAWAGEAITCWIKFDFNKSTRIDAIMTQQRDYTPNGTMPKEMILYGSNDDIFYEEVLTISNQILWSQAEGRIFKLDNAVSFRYYKLNVLENTGHSSSAVIGLIKFFQDDGKTEQITEKKASLNYCLPKNSTLAMNQRRNDLREGLLGFANDPDDRYGTLYLIDNKGQAIIPKASMAEADVLFEGIVNTNSSFKLLSSIYKYKQIIIEWSADMNTQYKYKKYHSYMVSDIVFTDTTPYTIISVAMNHTANQYAFGNVSFEDDITVKLNNLYKGYFTHSAITKIYGIK